MDLTWFQVTDTGEQELFTHTVEVTSFQTVYSIGTNPGTLALGTYRVDATFDGESKSTEFDVVAGAEARVGGLIGEGPTAGPPAAGDSGTVGPTGGPDTVFSETSFLDAWLSQEPVDPGAHDIILEIGAGVHGGGGRVEAYVEMAGNQRSLSIPTDEMGFVISHLSFNPCVHPGGSDLPGATAQFVTNLLGAGPQDFLADTVQNDTALGEDTSLPKVVIDAPAPSERHVAPGDQVAIDATAQENRDGPTWQTGIRSLKFVADTAGLVGEEQLSAAGSAQSCDQKQWTLSAQATYTVPLDAPPVIDICGEAEDFAGNAVLTCFDLYTGEVWDGTVHSVVTVTGTPGACGNSIAMDGFAQFVVADDGTVTGTYDIDGCAVSEPHAEFTGTVTDEAFMFPDLIVFTNGEPIPKVTPTHAQGTFTNEQGPTAHWVTTWDMTCSSCE